MTGLQRLLRGMAAMLLLAVSGFCIGVGYISCGGKFHFDEFLRYFVEKGPRTEWLWPVGGVMLAMLAVAVLTRSWKLRHFVGVLGSISFALAFTVLLLAADHRTLNGPGTNQPTAIVGGVLLVLTLVFLIVGAVRAGRATNAAVSK